MANVFDHLKSLYELELYDNVITLGNFVLTVADRCQDFLTWGQKFQTSVYYADALYQDQQYRKAEQIYMKALQLRKSLVGKSPQEKRSGILNEATITSEIEVKHRLHQCLVRQQKFKEAVGVLESVAPKSRPPKINMGLAKLYKRLEKDKASKDGYREVLKTCPLALNALVELLNLGVSPDEANGLMMGMGSLAIAGSAATSGKMVVTTPSTSAIVAHPCMSWLPLWLKAQTCLSARDYNGAVRNFRDLDSATPLSNNSRLLTDLGKSYYFGGENTKAITILQRGHSLDPLELEGMDILAALLAEEKRTKDLESLATQLMAESGESAQAWIAMGYLCKSLKKTTRAIYLAHKACTMGEKSEVHAEALLLKGLLLLESKKFSDALLHFQEGLAISPYRFELHEGLVNCFLERNKVKEALAAAQYCMKTIGPSARPLTLYASVLAKEPTSLDKAQDLLEKAVASAPHLLTAVYLLVDIYNTGGQYDRAIELLRQQANLHVKSRLHQMLGDFLSKSNKPSEALDRYRFALSLDPENVQAMSGMSHLEDQKGVDDAFITPQSSTAPEVLTAAPVRGRLFTADNEDSNFDSFGVTHTYRRHT